MEKTFKIRFGYCHIFDDKIVLTKSPEIKDLVSDYEKSINDYFKTLMVFLIIIPLFTALSVILYYEGKLGISLNAGAFALFFLVFAFYTILFTTGSPVIKKNTIIKIKFKKRLRLFNTIQIKYKSYGKIKTRSFVVENDQVETVLNLLKNEELIKEKDIDFNYGKIKTYSSIIAFILIFSLIQYFPDVFFNFLPKTERSSAGSGVFFLILSFGLITYMIQYPIRFIFKRKQKLKS